MPVKRGSDRLQKYQETKDRLFKSGSFIPYVILRGDGDTAVFRCVSDHDEESADKNGTPHVLTFADFHNVQMRSVKGKPFFKDVMCLSEFNEDTDQWEGECEKCVDGDRSSIKFLLWVWVKYYAHRRQNTDPKNAWEKVTVGKTIEFREHVNKFQVWKDGYYMEQELFDQIREVGTLMDRDFKVIRHGEANSTTVRRGLKPSANASDIDKIVDADGVTVLSLAADLPDLGDIASGKIETMDGKEKEDAYDEEDFDDVETADAFDTEVDDIDDLPF